MAAQHWDQERARTAGDIEHAAMATPIVSGSKRGSHFRRKGFDPVRKDLLLLIRKAVEMALPLAPAYRVFKVEPSRVTDLVPEAQHRPQTGAGTAGKKGRRRC